MGECKRRNLSRRSNHLDWSNRRPWSWRSALGRHGRRLRKQQRLKTGVIQRLRQRPGKACTARSAEVVADRTLAQPEALADPPLWQMLFPAQPQKFAYLSHRQSLTRHQLPGTWPFQQPELRRRKFGGNRIGAAIATGNKHSLADGANSNSMGGRPDAHSHHRAAVYQSSIGRRMGNRFHPTRDHAHR